MNPWPFLLISWGTLIAGNIALIVFFKKSTTTENKALFQTSATLLFAAVMYMAHAAYDVVYPNESFEHTIGLSLGLPLACIFFFSLMALGFMGLAEVKNQPRNLLTVTSLLSVTSLFLPFFFFILGATPLALAGWKLYKKIRK
ncbi:hypothetical protein [Planococcus citreus]|uniref:Uncharacterized protein n=1 Tax=Planococcus citreus TaxID=1373 RepID=A0A497YHY4_9BACL|nr:hypothetical protein [Planococcus citreus]RLJ86718.1 hypothetical protein DFR62_2321 [Planococcus citreus]